jgi:hypothetical protein
MVSTRRKDRIGAGCLTLFALPFVAVGAIALYFATAGLWTWQRMSGWTPVPADLERVELEHHRGDNSTTYRVVARYRYRYGGREYVGDRVAINSFSDNIGDFHERLYRQLQGARSRGEPVVAYVDPVDPVNATLNRDPRWLLTGFMTVFGLAFGIAGVGLLVGSRLSARRLTELRQLKERFPKQPWRWRKDWSEARVKASSRSTAYLAIGFATLWNLISLPVAVAVPAEAEKGNWSALVAAPSALRRLDADSRDGARSARRPTAWNRQSRRRGARRRRVQAQDRLRRAAAKPQSQEQLRKNSLARRANRGQRPLSAHTEP